MKRADIKKLLPSIMQRSMVNPRLSSDTGSYQTGSILSTFIEVMEQMHEPTEHLLENLHTVLDPRQVPECFLPMLAHWTNLIGLFQPDRAGTEPSLWKERTLPTEPGYLRELIATSVQLSQWRGTIYGLKKVLQMATGVSDFSIKEGTAPFHVQVGVPEAGRKYWELIGRIVEQEKPAHITAEIFIKSSKKSDDKEKSSKASDEGKSSDSGDKISLGTINLAN